MERERNMAEDEAEAHPAAPEGDAAWEARLLLRAARAATLATSAQGQPFASLVTPATAPDLSVLLLLSSLSEHTRHLRAEPRCALLVTGAPVSAHPQTAPRLTVTGLAEPDPDPALKARFLAVHPYAQLYADFGDFAVWRIRPLAGLFVGGFARAVRLRGADLLPDPAAQAAEAAAASALLAQAEPRAIPGHPGVWTPVGIDTDGCDFAQEETVLRLPWRAPIADAGAVHAELHHLSGPARQP
jgi:putative heme iron utilization protein